MARFLPQPYTLQSSAVGQNVSHDFLHRVFFCSTQSPEQSGGILDNGYLYLKYGIQFPDNTTQTTAAGGGGDVIIDISHALYFGDKTTNGSWRIIRSGNNLSVQRLESSVWTEKSAFIP